MRKDSQNICDELIATVVCHDPLRVLQFCRMFLKVEISFVISSFSTAAVEKQFVHHSFRGILKVLKSSGPAMLVSTGQDRIRIQR